MQIGLPETVLLAMVCITALTLAGCSTKASDQTSAKNRTTPTNTVGQRYSIAPGARGASTNQPGPIKGAQGTQLTLGSDIRGDVSSINKPGRYVVLSFPFGVMPSRGTELELRRGGVLIGRVRVTGPQKENLTVADLLKGDAQIGDQVAQPLVPAQP